MKPKNKPIDPPAGFKWVISKSMLSINGASALELGLWPVKAKPNELGLEHGKTSTNIAMATGYFTDERGIRKASKEAMKEFSKREAYFSLADRLVGEAINRKKNNPYNEP